MASAEGVRRLLLLYPTWLANQPAVDVVLLRGTKYAGELTRAGGEGIDSLLCGRFQKRSRLKGAMITRNSLPNGSPPLMATIGYEARNPHRRQEVTAPPTAERNITWTLAFRHTRPPDSISIPIKAMLMANTQKRYKNYLS